ncbi:hypothetical protein M413DRAFT_234813 [Hebeloma cylindrosporum]|uniref:Uncharacterized protein n=1 Tax=Hebeloma cylindrosporum TaxID=76867 RepID=A0A0C3BQV0_HEBCY|nr:hypothetical protein M413DRAFT_234813 [Hebeloma cylindrosporum h7]
MTAAMTMIAAMYVGGGGGAGGGADVKDEDAVVRNPTYRDTFSTSTKPPTPSASPTPTPIPTTTSAKRNQRRRRQQKQQKLLRGSPHHSDNTGSSSCCSPSAYSCCSSASQQSSFIGSSASFLELERDAKGLGTRRKVNAKGSRDRGELMMMHPKARLPLREDCSSSSVVGLDDSGYGGDVYRHARGNVNAHININANANANDVTSTSHLSSTYTATTTTTCSDTSSYVPYLPIIIQHERLQKRLRVPVSIEDAVEVVVREGGGGSVYGASSVGTRSVGARRSSVGASRSSVGAKSVGAKSSGGTTKSRRSASGASASEGAKGGGSCAREKEKEKGRGGERGRQRPRTPRDQNQKGNLSPSSSVVPASAPQSTSSPVCASNSHSHPGVPPSPTSPTSPTSSSSTDTSASTRSPITPKTPGFFAALAAGAINTSDARAKDAGGVELDDHEEEVEEEDGDGLFHRQHHNHHRRPKPNDDPPNDDGQHSDDPDAAAAFVSRPAKRGYEHEQKRKSILVHKDVNVNVLPPTPTSVNGFGSGGFFLSVIFFSISFTHFFLFCFGSCVFLFLLFIHSFISLRCVFSEILLTPIHNPQMETRIAANNHLRHLLRPLQHTHHNPNHNPNHNHHHKYKHDPNLPH